MDLSGSAFIAATAASAMARVMLICGVGYVLALYPKENPFFSQSIMKPLSRIANFVFVPCLIIYALGSGVTLDKVAAYGELIPGSLLIIGIKLVLSCNIFHQQQHLLLYTHHNALPYVHIHTYYIAGTTTTSGYTNMYLLSSFR